MLPRTEKQKLLSPAQLAKRLRDIDRITEKRRKDPAAAESARVAARTYAEKNRALVCERQRLYRQENLETARAKDRERYERRGEVQRKSLRDRYQADPEYRRVLAERNLVKKYGVDWARWDQMFEGQGGLCACCKYPLSRELRKTHVDHCHTINRVRGLLCSKCNRVLGLVGDSVPVLIRMVTYLERCHRVGGAGHDHLIDHYTRMREQEIEADSEETQWGEGPLSDQRKSTLGDERSTNEDGNEMGGRRAALMQKLGKAKQSGVGNNFKDGRYRLAIKSMGFQEGFKGMRYQVEFLVMNALKVPVMSIQTKQALDIEPNPVGSTVDWLCTDLDKDDAPGAGNLKRFILTLVGALDASDEDYLDTLAELSDVDENGDPLPVEQREQPGRGMVIDMETVRIETKKNKKEIVVCRFSHVSETQYDKAAILKWMDQVAAFQAAQAQLPAAGTAAAAA